MALLSGLETLRIFLKTEQLYTLWGKICSIKNFMTKKALKMKQNQNQEKQNKSKKKPNNNNKNNHAIFKF